MVNRLRGLAGQIKGRQCTHLLSRLDSRMSPTLTQLISHCMPVTWPNSYPNRQHPAAVLICSELVLNHKNVNDLQWITCDSFTEYEICRTKPIKLVVYLIFNKVRLQLTLCTKCWLVFCAIFAFFLYSESLVVAHVLSSLNLPKTSRSGSIVSEALGRSPKSYKVVVLEAFPNRAARKGHAGIIKKPHRTRVLHQSQ